MPGLACVLARTVRPEVGLDSRDGKDSDIAAGLDMFERPRERPVIGLRKSELA